VTEALIRLPEGRKKRYFLLRCVENGLKVKARKQAIERLCAGK
jgi:hypothetical protein